MAFGNVASREVEEAIYAIEGVSEVEVIGLPDPRWIESVTAVVVAKAGHVLTQAGILAACSGRLAHFKIPKHVILVEALPNKYPAPMNCSFHVGSEDWQSNPENVTKFASLLGLPVTIVPNAGHQLPKDYVSSLLDSF